MCLDSRCVNKLNRRLSCYAYCAGRCNLSWTGKMSQSMQHAVRRVYLNTFFNNKMSSNFVWTGIGWTIGGQRLRFERLLNCIDGNFSGIFSFFVIIGEQLRSRDFTSFKNIATCVTSSLMEIESQ